MKIVLKGTHEEVMGLMRAMVGGVIDNATMVAMVPPAQIPAPAPTVLTDPPPAFQALIHSWADGFDMDGTAHWDNPEPGPGTLDKGEALRDLGNSRNAGRTITWIRAQGGLTHAVQQILGGDSRKEKKIARGIAVNIAQVASILFTDLGETLEHFDPFED